MTEVMLDMGEGAGHGFTGQVLTGAAMDSRNSLDGRADVVPAAFNNARWPGRLLTVQVAAKSVVRLTLR